MVSIADDVFGLTDDDYSNETILLSGGFDSEVAKGALRAAGARFMMVDETGVEHPDMASLEDAVAAEDLYSPNYVSDPEQTTSGIELYVDCKSQIEEPMRLAFLRILVEELEASGLTDVSVTTPASEE